MQSLSIIYTTSREEPEFDWFMESLRSQWDFQNDHCPCIIVVDFHKEKREKKYGDIHTLPKPTQWQGRHRLTSEDFWAVSSGRNTGICLAKSDYVVFVDDRCVLGPEWVKAVKEAMAGGYMVCGSYEKRVNMEGDNGKILSMGQMVSLDNRLEHSMRIGLPEVSDCAGNWVYGCGIAMPLDWVLQVGGFEEAMDGAGFEDCIYGLMCQNNGFSIKYDRRMHLIEDRTPGFTGKPMRREDRGLSPNDASHRALEIFGTAKNTSNRHLLLQSRKAILEGKDFPLFIGPTDWWDACPISPNYMSIDNGVEKP